MQEEPVAAAATGPSLDELKRADAAREAGLTELQRYLDAEGGIAAAKHAGAALSEVVRYARHAPHQTKDVDILQTTSGTASVRSGRAACPPTSFQAWQYCHDAESTSRSSEAILSSQSETERPVLGL